MPDFVNLHCHTNYSMLDGFSGVDATCKEASRIGYQALAITDHGNMFGVVPFFQAAKNHGVKPILGIEAYFYHGDATERPEHGTLDPAYSHITLLAENNTGLANLYKLSSMAFEVGMYKRPRIDMNMLDTHHEGVIALSGCLSGALNIHALRGEIETALNVAGKLKDILGKDNLFIEYQWHNIADQHKANNLMANIQKKLGVEGVLTLDSHYATKDDSPAHRAVVAIGRHETLSSPTVYEPGGYYLRAPEEVAEFEICKTRPEFMTTSIEIAERCNVDIQLGRHLLPSPGLPMNVTSKDHLASLVAEGFKSRRANIAKSCQESKYSSSDYRNRIDKELQVINNTGFDDYFICVATMLKWAKASSLEISDGRGSVGGSLVAYLLHITEIDPIKYHLDFERFLNPSRISMPDIDIDVAASQHDQFVEHVKKVYGHEKVARLCAFSYLNARSAFRDAARIHGMPTKKINSISKLIPQSTKEKITLHAAIEREPTLRKLFHEEQAIFKTALSIEGTIRHKTAHASGYVIAPTDIRDHIPTCTVRSHGRTVVAAQADLNIAEKIGMVKFDFLRLKTLDVIADAKRFIGDDPITYDESDDKTWDMLSDGKCKGVFQMSSTFMQSIITKLQPRSVTTLALINAIGRPAAKKGLEHVISRATGKEPIEYPHELLKNVLKESYGCFVYQEQLMHAATDMAGMSLADADVLRKACSKKDSKLMGAQRDKFFNGCKQNGVSQEDAGRIFDVLSDFAAYGFNKAHAVAYGLLSYKTAWLKANYPVEFCSALLTHSADSDSKFLDAVEAADEMGIEILPPDINKSRSWFTPEGGKIRYGLAAIKGIGEATASAIEKAKDGVKGLGEFSTYYDSDLVPSIIIELDASKITDTGTIDELKESIKLDNEGFALMFRVIDGESTIHIKTPYKTFVVDAIAAAEESMPGAAKVTCEIVPE